MIRTYWQRYWYKWQLKREFTNWGYDFRRFSIESFKSWLEEEIQRQIFLIPFPIPNRAFGLWLSDAEDPYEYIFFPANRPSIYQNHIQLHEMCHIKSGHQTWPITGREVTGLLNGTISLDDFIPLALLRSEQKHTDEDLQAEMLASLIQERVIFHDRFAELTVAWSSNPIFAEHLKIFEA